MGAFFLIQRSKNAAARIGRASAFFSDAGFPDPLTFETQHAIVLKYAKRVPRHTPYFRNGADFCIGTGTIIYRSRTDSAALEAVYRDVQANSLRPQLLHGNFCVLIAIRDQLFLLRDPESLFHFWTNSSGTMLSSSLLALRAATGARNVNTQAAYEYVFQGATCGRQSIFDEILLIDATSSATVPKFIKNIDTTTNRAPAFIPSLQAAVERHTQNLRHSIAAVAKSFDGLGISMGLSGGYDSRLLLALLLDAGIQPHLHVYGRETDEDVKIARGLAEVANLPIEHVDKSSWPHPEPNQMPDLVRLNFLSFDGLPIDGIFDNGSDLQTRSTRSANAELHVNGGGGEVFRNFFYLPDHSFTVAQLLWSFYSQYDPQSCGSLFRTIDYPTELAAKIRQTLGRDNDTLRRTDVERVYPDFRCRFWMGKNNSINNSFSWFLTPFIDNTVLLDAINTPISLKNSGRLEAGLIKTISPALAAVTSSYGHNFVSSPPPFRVAKEALNRAKPTRLRRYAFRLKNWKPGARPYYLGEDYLRPVIDTQFPYMRKFFNIDNVRNAAQYNRVCTLEYFCQFHNVDM